MSLVLPVVLTGVLATASPGVLERVEMYRVTYQHADFAGAGVLKLGVESCEWLGRRGYAIVPELALVVPTHVTDCQAEHHRRAKPLHSLGIAADVDQARLNGLHAVVLLTRPP